MAELTEADLLALDTELARLPDRHEGTYVEARLALAEKVPRLLATIRMLWARLEEAGELGGKMADVCFTVGQQRTTALELERRWREWRKEVPEHAR